MLVREYNESDLDALRAIHVAQGFDYAFPDLRNPLFVTKLVLTDDVVAQAFRPEGVALDGKGGSQTNSLIPKGMSYNLPEAPYPLGNGAGEKILGAALLRLTSEAYLLLDPRSGTPRERWQWLLALHEAASRDAWQRGLEDVHAWLPPPIAQKFGRRLARLGWRRDDAWTPYCRRLEGK